MIGLIWNSDLRACRVHKSSALTVLGRFLSQHRPLLQGDDPSLARHSGLPSIPGSNCLTFRAATRYPRRGRTAVPLKR